MARSRTLDLLRTLAVLLVLGRHMNVCPPKAGRFMHELTTVWNRGGWVGVDLFFVLSGFLVSGLIFTEHRRYGTVSPGNFVLRRGLKIYPAFYVLMLATLVAPRWGGRPVPGSQALAEMLFVQNYVFGFWNHTWSLAVEEHFYLLLILAATWAARRDPTSPFDAIPRAFVAVAIACLVLRCATAWGLRYSHFTHLAPTHLRIDSLLFGTTIAYFWHYRRESLEGFVERAGRARLAAAGVALLAPAFAIELGSTWLLSTFGFTGFYLGSGMLLLSLLGREPSTNLAVRLAAFLGSRSYSIYLWHMPFRDWILPILRRQLSGGWYVNTAVYFLGVMVLGVVMAHLVEMPVLRLRERFFPSRSAA